MFLFLGITGYAFVCTSTKLIYIDGGNEESLREKKKKEEKRKMKVEIKEQKSKANRKKKLNGQSKGIINECFSF